MIVISLGWGVQSFALAAMVAKGILPKVDAAVHSDTAHERAGTYEFARRWTPWLEERGVRVVTVSDPPRGEVDEWGGVSVPAFTTWSKDAVWCPKYICAGCGEYAEDTSDCESCGSMRVVSRSVHEQREPRPLFLHRAGDPSGMLRRQCTKRWKIQPTRRWVRKRWLKIDNKSPLQQWMGITLDEVQRMRQSDVKYIKNVYPFVEMLDRPWTRSMVVRWLLGEGLEVPPWSSCVF